MVHIYCEFQVLEWQGCMDADTVVISEFGNNELSAIACLEDNVGMAWDVHSYARGAMYGV